MTRPGTRSQCELIPCGARQEIAGDSFDAAPNRTSLIPILLTAGSRNRIGFEFGSTEHEV